MLPNEILTVLACAVIFYVLTRKWFFNLRQRFFVLIMTSIGRSTDIALRAMNLKPAHTAPLANIVSADPELRKKKQMRIMEVGAGSGHTLCDYPEGTQLILVDINDKFEPILRSKCSRMQGITLEKFYATDAADMHEIPDGSVDAVITQFSLCSCSDVPSVLSEVRRVLAPGGKYYFSEHVIDKYSFWRRLLQWFIHYSGIWGYIGLGCNPAKDTGGYIKKSGFSHVDMKETYLPVKFHFLLMVSGPTIIGVATK